jgi:deferrochelatase/peroxidase EfeB
VAAGHAGADVLDTPLALRDIEPEDVASRMLRTLQANILHPHVRTHLRVLALRIDHPLAARRALAELATHLKSAADQFAELNAYRSSREPGSAYAGVGLSASGYERLGVDPTEWPGDPAFRSGMRQRNLGDPDPQRFESGYREPIDALVVVGSHSKKLTARKVREVMKVLGGSMRVVARETGRTLTNANGDGIEHFGYVDGRSQPLFIEEDLEHERETMDGVDIWNPLVPLREVLVPDPGAERPRETFGSFLVYRKLEQNVRAFKKQEARIARKLGLEGDDAERAGALLVGRFEDGTPVVLQSAAGMHNPVPNNFTYASDPAGTRCPYAGHTRRMNARPEAIAGRTVIARRGQGYGIRKDDPNAAGLAGKPTRGVGLLFMAVVARIEDQFEALQLTANGEVDGVFDAVMGQVRDPDAKPPVSLSGTWGGPADPERAVAVKPCVRMRGGEYFFLPSIDSLIRLGKG